MASTSKTSEVRNPENKQTICQAAVEAIKAEFNEKLRNLILSTEQTGFDVSKMWSKFYLNKLIEDVKREQEMEKLVNGHYVNKYKDKFDIGITKDTKKEQLVVKHEGVFKLFPAWQDIFDIIWPLHLQHNHPKPEVIQNMLQNYFLIKNVAFELLNEVCSICLGEDKPFMRCSVYILEMDIKDSAFDRIMVYEEVSTGFIHMAPMTSETIVIEMSLELLRLFMDYGPPKKLLINDKIVETSVDQVKHLTQFAPFHLETINVHLDITYMNRLKDLISDWTILNFSPSWGIACFAVKWRLNNTIDKHYKTTPFARVFRRLGDKNAKEVEELDRTNLPSTSSATEKVLNPVVPENLGDQEMILPAIQEGSVSSLAPTVDVKETTCLISDGETDESEVFLEIDDSESLDAEDPLAID